MKFDQPKPNVFSPEWVKKSIDKKEVESLRSSEEKEKNGIYEFLIRSSDSKLLAFVGVILCPEEISKEYGPRKEIKEIVFKYKNKEGVMCKYDLLKRFNVTGAKVYLEPELRSGGQARSNNTIAIKEIKFMTPHFILHELRHAWQHQSPDFRNNLANYRSVMDYDYEDENYFFENNNKKEILEIIKPILLQFLSKELIENILEKLNKMETVKDRKKVKLDFLDKWKELYMKIEFFKDEYESDELNKKKSSLENISTYYHNRGRGIIYDKCIMEYESVTKELPKFGLMLNPEPGHEFNLDNGLGIWDPIVDDLDFVGPIPAVNFGKDTVVIAGLTLKDILHLPTLIIERDAEYGALVGLRTLRQETGIDLLAEFKKPIYGYGLDSEKVQKTRESIDSLRWIAHHMQMIGVPLDCFRDLNKMARKGAKKETEEEDDLAIAAK